MIDEVLQDLEESLDKAIAALRRELSKVRTGRAHPSILDRIRVDYYGVATPLSQMSTVTVPDARLLVVKAWERGQVKAIDKAIRESQLGLNPQVDGDLIRIPIPPLTEDRRKEMVKMTKRAAEDGKVALRKHRRDAMTMLGDLQKEGEVSEDNADRARKKVEDVVADKVKEVDQAVADREKDIMEV
jgi:ribosome recycling factor